MTGHVVLSPAAPPAQGRWLGAPRRGWGSEIERGQRPCSTGLTFSGTRRKTRCFANRREDFGAPLVSDWLLIQLAKTAELTTCPRPGLDSGIARFANQDAQST